MTAGDSETSGTSVAGPRIWPMMLISLGALVAIWSGWVGIGEMAGFGVIHPLPGIWNDARINTAITLPIGIEAYASYAVYVWFHRGIGPRARKFARTSSMAAFGLGALGQVAYHLLAAAGVRTAPAYVTTLVSVLPVTVTAMGAILVHLARTDRPAKDVPTETAPATVETIPPPVEAVAPPVPTDTTWAALPATTPPQTIEQWVDDRALVALDITPATFAEASAAEPKPKRPGGLGVERGLQIMTLASEGRTNREIAAELGISERTVYRARTASRRHEAVDNN